VTALRFGKSRLLFIVSKPTSPRSQQGDLLKRKALEPFSSNLLDRNAEISSYGAAPPLEIRGSQITQIEPDLIADDRSCCNDL
jgi:hypothetical protein